MNHTVVIINLFSLVIATLSSLTLHNQTVTLLCQQRSDENTLDLIILWIIGNKKTKLIRSRHRPR